MLLCVRAHARGGWGAVELARELEHIDAVASHNTDLLCTDLVSVSVSVSVSPDRESIVSERLCCVCVSVRVGASVCT